MKFEEILTVMPLVAEKSYPLIDFFDRTYAVKLKVRRY